MKLKQLLALLLAMVLVLSMTACGASSKEIAQSLLEGDTAEEAQEEEPAEVQEEEPEPVEEVVEEPVPMPETSGYYLIYSAESDAGVQDREMLAQSVLGSMYFRFHQDGTGIAHLDGEEDVPLLYDESSITIDGESQFYSLEDDSLILELVQDGETATLTFTHQPGEPPEPEVSIVGWWEVVSGTSDGITYNKEELAALGLANAIFVFFEDGTGYDQADGVPSEAVTYDDSCIYYTADGSIFSYTLDGATLVIESEAASLTLTRGVGEPPAPAVTVDPMVDYWDGQWYGWWVIWSGTGAYADFNGNWWDVAAEIEYDGDNASIVLWDQDYPRSDPLGELDLIIDSSLGASEYGGAISTSGYFYTDPIETGDWTIDPSDSEYENLLTIDGEAVDQNGDTFQYSIYLRPWGLYWDDIEAESPEDLPYFYYDWYLPLIEAGQPIPDELPNDGTASSES